jgi:hypothetical protein
MYQVAIRCECRSEKRLDSASPHRTTKQSTLEGRSASSPLASASGERFIRFGIFVTPLSTSPTAGPKRSLTRLFFDPVRPSQFPRVAGNVCGSMSLDGQQRGEPTSCATRRIDHPPNCVDWRNLASGEQTHKWPHNNLTMRASPCAPRADRGAVVAV